MSSLFRTGILGGALVLCTTATFWVSISACESLSQTSPLPPDDASDLDAGQPPEMDDTTSSSSSSGSAPADAGVPNAARFRLSNQLQGPDAIDYCVTSDPTGKSWTSNLVSENIYKDPKPDGVFFGETSQSNFVLAAASGSKFLVKITPPGTDCSDPTATVYAAFALSSPVKPGAAVTVVAVGKLESGVDAGDATGKGTSMNDILAPPANASLFRVFHGATDIAAFDVVINGETIITGVKYGTAIGYAYTSSTGYASIAAGIPEGSTLTLRSGTTVRSFAIPDRLRRGIATTVFVGGTKEKLTVNLCSDRTPDKGDTATCQKLAAQE
jgi:hypothetical protein